MIDPHWLVEDLDPRTWRAIGRFFMPSQYVAAAQPGEHGLFILHDNGARPRVVDDQVGPRPDIGIERVDDPRALALELHERAEWDRVHVIDRRHLMAVARTAQATPRRELTLDAYYHLVYQLIWDESDGYVCVPERPRVRYGLSYANVSSFVARLPSPSTIGLCVFDDAGSVEIGLALGFRAARIVRVTTLEGLPPLRPSLSSDFLNAFCDALAHAIAPVATAIVCTHTTFQDWLQAQDKRNVLNEALRKKAAFWRPFAG